MTLTEIDERPILGNGGTVTLYLRDDGTFQVDVLTPTGDQLTRFHPLSGTEAVSAFLHPFADPTTPDVFARHANEKED